MGNQEVRREDVIEALKRIAFGKANDCVRLVLEPEVEVQKLDLSLLAEIKRSDKGVEVKLIDRVRALERLLDADEDGSGAAAFFAAALDGDEA